MNSRHTVLFCSGEICASISMCNFKSNVSVLLNEKWENSCEISPVMKIYIHHQWMSLGAGVYKVSNWLGNALAREREPWEHPPQDTVIVNSTV